MLLVAPLLLALAVLPSPSASAGVGGTGIPSLSKKAQDIYNHVLATSQKSPAGSAVPADAIRASGRVVTDVADYGSTSEHCDKIFYPAFVAAEEEVLITTFLFDKSAPCGGKIAAKALTDLNKRLEGSGKKVRVYFIASVMSELAFWLKGGFKLPRLRDVFRTLSESDPAQFYLPSKAELPNLDFRIKTFHEWAFGTVHSKLFVVDGRILISGSKNWDALPGFEYVARMEGTIAASARQDFVRLWQEPIPNVSTLATQAKPGEFPILYLSRSQNAYPTHPEDNTQDQGWIRALEIAEKSVYIQSPNFITQTVVDKVLEAVKRGVKVTVITSFSFHDIVSYFNTKSAGNNRSTIRKMYTQLLGDPAATKNLVMCYFMGNRVTPPVPVKTEFAHVKFMSVDDEFTIFGSGNQDTQSWYNSCEANFLLDNAQETQRITKKLLDAQKSLQYCYRDANGEKLASDPTWMDSSEPVPEPPEPSWM